MNNVEIPKDSVGESGKSKLIDFCLYIANRFFEQTGLSAFKQLNKIEICTFKILGDHAITMIVGDDSLSVKPYITIRCSYRRGSEELVVGSKASVSSLAKLFNVSKDYIDFSVTVALGGDGGNNLSAICGSGPLGAFVVNDDEYELSEKNTKGFNSCVKDFKARFLTNFHI